MSWWFIIPAFFVLSFMQISPAIRVTHLPCVEVECSQWNCLCSSASAQFESHPRMSYFFERLLPWDLICRSLLSLKCLSIYHVHVHSYIVHHTQRLHKLQQEIEETKASTRDSDTLMRMWESLASRAQHIPNVSVHMAWYFTFMFPKLFPFTHTHACTCTHVPTDFGTLTVHMV